MARRKNQFKRAKLEKNNHIYSESKVNLRSLLKRPELKKSIIDGDENLLGTNGLLQSSEFKNELRQKKRVRICVNSSDNEDLLSVPVSDPESNITPKKIDQVTTPPSTRFFLSDRLNSLIHHGQNYMGFCPLLTNDFTVPRIAYNSVTPKKFFDSYVKQRRPCILTVTQQEIDSQPIIDDTTEGVSEFFPMLRQWKDINYLKKFAGNVDVDVEVADEKSMNDELFTFSGKRSHSKIKFSNLLDEFQSGNSKYYLTTQTESAFSKEPLSLGSDLVLQTNLVEDYPNVPSILNTLIPHQYNIWMGSCSKSSADSLKLQYSSSGLHHDFHDNFYIMVKGTKTFRLFSPRVAELLQTKSKIHLMHPNGLICYESGRRSDGANKISVLRWRSKHIDIEIVALMERLKRLEEEQEQLQNLCCNNKLPKKRKANKKKKKKPAMILQNPLFDEFLATAAKCRTEESYRQFLHEEIQLRKESASLVKNYIQNALKRKDEYLLTIKQLRKECEDESTSSNDSTIKTCTTTPTTSLEHLENSLTTEQKKVVGKKKKILKSLIRDDCTKDEPANFSNLSTLTLFHPDAERVIEDDKKIYVETEQDLLKYYVELKLEPNEMIYIPASWFHEVISRNTENEDYHLAFNFWFYPPDAPKCTHSNPYIDEYWSKRYKRLLGVAQLKWQSQAYGIYPGTESLIQLLSTLQSRSTLTGSSNNLTDLEYEKESDEDDDLIRKTLTSLGLIDINDDSALFTKQQELFTESSNSNALTLLQDLPTKMGENSDLAATILPGINSELAFSQNSADNSKLMDKSVRAAYKKHMKLKNKRMFSAK